MALEGQSMEGQSMEGQSMEGQSMALEGQLVALEGQLMALEGRSSVRDVTLEMASMPFGVLKRTAESGIAQWSFSIDLSRVARLSGSDVSVRAICGGAREASGGEVRGEMAGKGEDGEGERMGEMRRDGERWGETWREGERRGEKRRGEERRGKQVREDGGRWATCGGPRSDSRPP